MKEMAVTEVMLAQGLRMHTALAQNHIPAQVGMLQEGPSVVANPTISGRARTHFILVSFPGGNTAPLIPMPANTPQRTKMKGLTVAWSMWRLVRTSDSIHVR